MCTVHNSSRNFLKPLAITEYVIYSAKYGSMGIVIAELSLITGVPELSTLVSLWVSKC